MNASSRLAEKFSHQDRLDLVRVVQQVGFQIQQLRQTGDLAITKKTGEGDIVTTADHLGQKAIGSYLKEIYPNITISGEESGDFENHSKSSLTFFIDPVDGTAIYSKGHERYGVSVGLISGDQPILGVVGFPALNQCISCLVGDGVFFVDRFQGRSVSLPPVANDQGLRGAFISYNWVDATRHFWPPSVLFQTIRGCYHYGCSVYELLLLAQGKLDAYIHMGATPFDIAGSLATTTELGCVASGIWEDGLDFTQPKIPTIIARSQRLADELREAILRELPTRPY
jgi:myo-inositol-1(or 4)-monophosphatase